MRSILVSALVLGASAATALPAAAAIGDHAPQSAQRSAAPVWGDDTSGGGRIRLARATRSDSFDDADDRPSRSSRGGRQYGDGVTYEGRRQRTAKKGSKGRHHASRRGKRHVAAHARRRAPQHARGPVGTRLGAAARGSFMGMASFYWQPQRLASGGWFNPSAMTAAHKSLPFGTRVRVTHLTNGRTVDVRINDRGPYIAGRIIDLSKAAASVIGMTGQGVARVKMDVLGR